MSKVVAIMSMSLDGYVADLDDGVAEVFDWYFTSGDVKFPAGWPRPDSSVHFVTDGIESAVSQARAAAAGKSVGVHGADTVQQCLNAGLLDELYIDVAAVLLGSGVRLFDRLAGAPAILGNPTVVPGIGVTHLRSPVRTA
jgi:dihydrofolate reductase